MIIAVGSTNPAKVNAVRETWQELVPDVTVLSASIPSGVRNQPFSDDETIQGAIHRARQAKKELNADVGIGLEGGVVETPFGLFLCNWSALADENDQCLIAGGARIPLPDQFRAPLHEGRELGPIMDEYSKQTGIRHHQGAIGVFTNGLVDRKEMLIHLCKILLGQYQFHKLKNG
ncbi:DUF84 family protein [Thermoactinomyces mirandus]|uniref:Probable inosine/xanthosine triphosphatase n=1 Tax=Thermoactinomyces mirandus TaxID=2756294 RepID=A0A7W2AS02_9BACL|nr:DUF84 family protein [Thermoactinomyces mirandus]MBA4603529.1 DUF84 family protein [Thermoactinomyces mirandus]